MASSIRGHQCTSAIKWSGMFVMCSMQWCMSVSAVL